jgi:hypothetical protein
MGWTIGVLGFDFQRGRGIFLFTTASKTALGPTQPPIQWVPGALSLEVKRPGSVADHSLPSSAEVKECVELYLHYPSTPSWRGAQLKIKHRDNFTLPFTMDGIIRNIWFVDVFLSSGCCEHGNEHLGSLEGGKFFWLAEWLLAFQEGFGSMKLISEWVRELVS